ncbi:MAG TPA: hypothetical protein VM779_10215, partial [Thermoanaerobaculia bacterium]|nr:hypothetical protein [Thermoanaerobaculia bacterium]
MTSEIGGPPQEPVAPAAVPAKSGWARVAGVLFAPAETFRDIARKPDILIPLAVIVLVAAIGSVIIAPRIDFET